VVARDVTLTWQPRARDEAISTLTAWLQAWALHTQRPLPIAVKTALTFLALRDEKGEAVAYTKAAETYHGVFKMDGEKDRRPSLSRQFPDFDTLWQSGDFAHWASVLYQPMLTALQFGALTAISAEDQGDDA
jgi:exodeoxyribonuclease V gamma subunit